MICGHIHQPEIRTIENEEGKVVYLNSGDWVENMTALEYENKTWQLFHYDPKNFSGSSQTEASQTLNVITDDIMILLSKA